MALQVRFTVTDATGLTGSGTTTLDVQASATQPVNYGETAIMSGADSGNGNLLLAQNAVFAKSGTLQSLSFYVTNVGGQLRLGVYDASGPNGGPGALKAQTNAFTPIVGWNTQAVVAPVTLAAGTYWLAYHPQSGALGFRDGQTAGVVGRFYSHTFGALPATFAASPNTTNAHWSLYATMLVAATPAVPVVTPASFNVPSGYVNGSIVGNVVATNNPASFAITAGNASGYFAITSTGVLKIAATGPVPPSGSYSLTIVAANANGVSPGAVMGILLLAGTGGDGFPNASNTGVPSGSSLTPHSGDISSSANDQIIELLDQSGAIIVTHARVTVRKCKVNGPGGTGNFVVVYVTGADCVVQDCTITNGVGGGKGVWIDGATGATVQRCNISDAEDGIYMTGSGHTILDNYIHGLVPNPDDPPGSAHHDGIQSDSTGSLVQHNAIRTADNPEMSSAMTNGPSSNMTINNNLFQGGAYILRVEVAGSSGYVITNNQLQFGSTTSGYWDLTGTNGQSPTISGNVDYVTKAAINWP